MNQYKTLIFVFYIINSSLSKFCPISGPFDLLIVFLLDLQVNVKDARFQAMYTSHLFNLDPSDPNFKKTKAMEKILEEKARQREQKEQELTQTIKKKESEIQKEPQKRSIDPALSMLIKSVKNKTEQFQARKKQKVK